MPHFAISNIDLTQNQRIRSNTLRQKINRNKATVITLSESVTSSQFTLQDNDLLQKADFSYAPITARADTSQLDFGTAWVTTGNRNMFIVPWLPTAPLTTSTIYNWDTATTLAQTIPEQPLYLADYVYSSDASGLPDNIVVSPQTVTQEYGTNKYIFAPVCGIGNTIFPPPPGQTGLKIFTKYFVDDGSSVPSLDGQWTGSNQEDIFVTGEQPRAITVDTAAYSYRGVSGVADLYENNRDLNALQYLLKPSDYQNNSPYNVAITASVMTPKVHRHKAFLLEFPVCNLTSTGQYTLPNLQIQSQASGTWSAMCFGNSLGKDFNYSGTVAAILESGPNTDRTLISGTINGNISTDYILFGIQQLVVDISSENTDVYDRVGKTKRLLITWNVNTGLQTIRLLPYNMNLQISVYENEIIKLL